jgi:hypothetical protein
MAKRKKMRSGRARGRVRVSRATGKEDERSRPKNAR